MVPRAHPVHEDALNAVVETFAAVMRGAGAVLVLVALAGITFEVYAYFAIIMPAWYEAFSLPWLGTTAVGVWILVLVMHYYLSTVFTPPGYAPPGPQPELHARMLRLAPPSLLTPEEADALSPREGGDFSTVDFRTGGWKPPRSHYDNLTGRLVLRFDHYCPWVWNAVGHGNYKFFVGFLLSLLAGCIFTSALASRLVSFSGQGTLARKSPGGLEDVAFFLPLAVGVALALFAAWHLFLVCTNQTTIEFFHNLRRRARALERGHPSANFYDLGPWANVRQVCGRAHPCSWLLPVWTPPEGNGLEFPTHLKPEIEYSRLGDDGKWLVPADEDDSMPLHSAAAPSAALRAFPRRRGPGDVV